MPKSDIDKQFNKLKRDMEKQAKDQIRATKRKAAKERTSSISTNIISNFRNVSGFTVMNTEAEELLQAILDQYDGNSNLFVSFDSEKVDRALCGAVPQYLDVLEQMGLIARRFSADNGDFFSITYSGRDYFKNKQEAEEREQKEKERKEKLETDIVKIQSMNADQLRNIYIQAVQANTSLKSSLELEKKQLDVLKNLFASGEDGVAVQKEIMKYVEEIATPDQKEFLKDKLGDVGVSLVLGGIEAWLRNKGLQI